MKNRKNETEQKTMTEESEGRMEQGEPGYFFFF
jgi:hypothetical protein